MGPSGCWSLKTPGGVATNGALVLAGPGKQTLTAGIRPSLDLGFSPVAVTRGGRGSWSSLLPNPGFADVPDALAATAGGRLIALGLHQARPGRRPARSPPDPPPRQRELGRGPQFGQVHAEPFPHAGLARLGHGDDAADLPGRSRARAVTPSGSPRLASRLEIQRRSSKRSSC